MEIVRINLDPIVFFKDSTGCEFTILNPEPTGFFIA